MDYLIFNGLTVTTVGWLYITYFKNLNASLKAKDEQLKITEKNLLLWKDKANNLEKKTPEYIEEVLAKRIKHREEEIIIPDSEISIVELGEIFVDTASVLITDPLYARDEWRDDVEYEDIRIYKHSETKKIYQYGIDFQKYTDIIEGFDKDVNQLRDEKILQEIEIERKYTYSYAGAAYASLSKEGYGELEFKPGHKGAGICIRTVYGDGYYRVYGEKYQDNIVRVYIDLQ